jgi:lipopolysaccharide export system protein LptA
MKGIGRWLRRPRGRRGKALGLALLGVCTAGSQATSDPQEQTKGITISLGADDFEYSDADQTAVLSGGVRLRAKDLPGPVPEVEMEGQRITVNLGPGDVLAEGTTVARAPGLEIRGDELRGNLRTGEFHARNARTVMVAPLADREVTVFAQSDSIDVTGRNAELRRARVTTCEQEHPHYALLVRRAEVIPARDRLTIYGGAIELYGLRVPVIPKFNKSLGQSDDRGAFDLALPGRSAVDGWYYPLDRRFSDPEAPLQARMSVRLTQNSLITGRLLTDYTRGPLHTWATVVRHSSRADDITGRLLYDALPEAGVRFSRGIGPSTLSAQISGGYYRERDLRTEQRAAASAATVSLGWDWRRPLPGRDAAVWAGVGTRGSLYSGGDSYRTIDLHVGASRPLWSDATGRLEFLHHFIGGHTPFEFDDIDLKTEVRGELSTPLFGPLGVTLGGRYDLERPALRDYDVGLHYRRHCLTWSISYNGAHDSFGVGVNLTDFMFGGRPRVQGAPKGTLGPWRSVAAQPLQREGLEALPEPTLSPTAPLTVAPTEFALARDAQQRAPDAAGPNLPPPPFLRLVSATMLQ